MRTKICLAVMLCFMFLVTGAAIADRDTFDDTKTRVAMPLSEPPVIDGIIDFDNGESWINAGGALPGGGSYWTIEFSDAHDDFTIGGNVTTGDGPLFEGDFAAEIYVGYDDDNLYVAVRVTDDIFINDTAEAESMNGQTWLDDSVEVFVDGDNSNYDQRDTAGDRPEGFSTGGQYVVTANNAYREQEAGNPGYGPDAAWYGLSDIAPNGAQDYEFRISWDILGGKPEQSRVVGFDLAFNDDDSGGDSADNSYTWSGLTHVEDTYGNLVIGPRTYTAPLAESAPTVDGEISDGEYGGAEVQVVTHHTGNYNGDDDWELGDHDYSFQVVHDDEAIYVGLQVTDDQVVTDTAEAGSEDGSTWLDDSVEVFFDSDASDDSGRTSANEFEGQFVLTPIGAFRDNEANNPLFGEGFDWYAAAQTTDTGYSMEFKVLKEILFEMQQTMGFDVAVNDDDGADRKTQLAWNGRPHNELSYGDLVLSEGGTNVAEWPLY